jgi:hypothetical protein
MRVRTAHIRSFKRFTDLTIEGISESTRLVLMIGPNGSGKSSVFDAFRVWHRFHGVGSSVDDAYHRKTGIAPALGWNSLVEIQFHDPLPSDEEGRKKIFYARSAYRNEPDFTSEQLSRVGQLLDAPRVERMIDNDVAVSGNYRRLVSSTLAAIYDGYYDSLSVSELREAFVGEVRSALAPILPGLKLKGPGDPLKEGSFFFEKGTSKNFHYKNLSAGEKAAFDLVLDFVTKRRAFDNTVFCIDEPEAHMHTQLQAQLLETLFDLIPDNCQLWLATHSIGMMRSARDLQLAHPDQVCFLDYRDHDFDNPVTIRPALVDRGFWLAVLEVALGDLASLVAPSTIVLCEGQVATGVKTRRGEFDAQCYRHIFSEEFADTDFVSVGNGADVESDRIGLGRAIQTLSVGSRVIRVVDRDDRTEAEIAELRSFGVRVLSRRAIENYLLDDEVIRALCENAGQPTRVAELLDARGRAVAESVSRGNAPDDLKSAAGTFYNEVRKLLSLTRAGNTADVFLRDTMAQLIRPSMAVYQALRVDIFG